MATADKERCTLVWGTGTMASTILRRAVPPENPSSSVERALFVPLSVPDQLEFERRYGCAVFGSYGQSEFLVVAVEDPTHERRRTAGHPVDSLELRILDDDDNPLPPGAGGEIALRPLTDHAMFSGYWNNREATEAAWSSGWYHTGDFGLIDDAGELRFLDRKKDAVRRRGENVSCYEVETALVAHPDISQAAVFGVPSDLGEDDIVAALVVEAPLTPPALHAFLSERLPYFAMPRYVEFIDEVPVTATGKITKVPLRESGVTPDAWDFEALGLSVSVSKRRATSTEHALTTGSGTGLGEALADQPVQG